MPKNHILIDLRRDYSCIVAMEKNDLYTLRWYVSNKWGEPTARDEVLELLGEMLDEGPTNRPSKNEKGAKHLWYPLAYRDFQPAITRGTYEQGYPKGAVVHFTAGRRAGLEKGLADQVKDGFCYFLIDKDGNVGQNFPLDQWGYHAGDSKKYPSDWPGLNFGVSDQLVGIEIQCAGKLSAARKSWFHKTYPVEETRKVKARHNIQAGTYHKFTDEQEEALIGLLLWLQRNNPEVFEFRYVLGHDEVSGKRGIGRNRKNDPGGSLSMSMDELRELLKKH